MFEICKTNWLPEDVEIHQDIVKIRCKLSLSEKHLMTQVFNYLPKKTQSLYKKYEEEERFFTIASFLEAKHLYTYEYLFRNFQIAPVPLRRHQEFQEIQHRNKFLSNDSLHCNYSIAKNLAMTALYRENLEYYTSFIILSNLKMKGLSEILLFIMEDKKNISKECAKIFNSFKNRIHIQEELEEDIYDSIQLAISNEFTYIDCIFEDIHLPNLTTHQLKNYVLWRASKNLKEIGIEKAIPLAPEKNPIEWFDSEYFEAPITQCINEESDE